MINSKKNIILYTLISAIFILSILLLLLIKKRNFVLQEGLNENTNGLVSNQNSDNLDGTITTTTTTTTTKTVDENGKGNNVDVLLPLTYAEVTEKYKDSRIQFNEKCQASPNNIVLKNNAYVMLDNRAGFPQVININANYALEAHSFEIMKLSSNFLPMIWHVNCGQNKNVATILLQP
jgi:hypothetical protein